MKTKRTTTTSRLDRKCTQCRESGAKTPETTQHATDADAAAFGLQVLVPLPNAAGLAQNSATHSSSGFFRCSNLLH